MHRAPVASVLFVLSHDNASIDDSISSVLRQSFADWELLLVDYQPDASGFNRARDAIQKVGSRATYLNLSDSLSAPVALNRAILQAQGEFIAFLYSGDLWCPEHLERQIAVLNEGSYLGYSISPALLKNRDTNLSIQMVDTTSHGVQAPGKLLANLLRGDEGAFLSALTVRAELARRIGGLESTFSGELQLFVSLAFVAKLTLATSGYVQSTGSIVPSLAGLYDLAVGPDELLAARVGLYEWLLAYLNEPAARPGRSRLLTTMVRYRLFDTLGRLSRLPAGEASEINRRSQPGGGQRSVGLFFTGIDRLGALHIRAPAALGRAAFNVSIVAYEKGTVDGVKLVSQYVTSGVGRILPRALRPART
jgi:glycosyltransferase involved in cell wall biosynthesis